MVSKNSKAGFDASEYDELSYDFTKFIPGCKGVTPEPSSAKVRRFQRTMKDLIGPEALELKRREEAGEMKVTLADMEKALSVENEEEAAEAFEGVIAAVGELCTNDPSAEQIGQLPHRIKEHYVGYITGKFLSGEG